MVRTVPIDDPAPSQLYVDARSLRSVLSWFDFDDPGYDPVDTYAIDGETVILDGHTRALVAFMSGADSLRVRSLADDEVDDSNRPLYRECLRWCRADGITAVADLSDRVVSGETYEREWIDRCHASPHYG